MNEDKKIIVSDYDETFYINDEDIEKNKTAVREFEAKGNLFIIATGRSYLDFKNKVKDYHINYNYAILNHGATIIDRNDNIIYNFPMDNEVIKKMKDEINTEKSVRFFCCSALESRVDITHRDLTKIHIKYHTKEEAMLINKTLNNKYAQYINSYYVSGDSVEVISNKINKSKSIRLLTQKFNMDTKNIYTIGDGFSDIEMVKDFNGYCMEDSVEELKKVAKKAYKSVSELITEVMDKKRL